MCVYVCRCQRQQQERHKEAKGGRQGAGEEGAGGCGESGESVCERKRTGKRKSTQAIKTTLHINKEKEPLWYWVP